MSSHGPGQPSYSSSYTQPYPGHGGSGGMQPQQPPQPPYSGQGPEREWRCLKCGNWISNIQAEAAEHNRMCNGRCVWVCRACQQTFDDHVAAEQHVYSNHWQTGGGPRPSQLPGGGGGGSTSGGTGQGQWGS